MMKLHARTAPWVGQQQVLRVSTRAEQPHPNEVLLTDGGVPGAVPGFGSYLNRSAQLGQTGPVVPEALSYLRDGDVVRLSPERGEIGVLYRRDSPHNTMLLTDNCNSNCVMCSQPPKTADDSYLSQVWQQAIRLMSPETQEIGMSGGEPTLLGDRFIELLEACNSYLPRTALHVLSNGRMFNYLSLAKAVAAVGNPDLMFGIPLYSDLPARHDFVVQAEKAFDQTIRGITNLKRVGARVELRVVIHKETVTRLPQLARFITRNLPFVDQVVLMGLELTGHTRANLDALWVDPALYASELLAAVTVLRRANVNVSVYNHQLCVIDEALWPVAKRSISDWKNEYLETCGACSLRAECGGFFASGRAKVSAFIRPIVGRNETGVVEQHTARSGAAQFQIEPQHLRPR